MIRKYVSLLLFLILINSSSLFSQEEQSVAKGTIDGVPVKALERSIKPDRSSIFLGADYLPMNPYYEAIGVAGSYQFNFTRTFGWEIVRGAYYFTTESTLTSELADKYNVNPKKIEKIKYLVKSNLKYYFIYGKFLWFDSYIKHCRIAILFGPGVVATTEETKFLGSAGFSLEFFLGESVTLAVEFQDNVSYKDEIETFPAFSTGFNLLF